MTIPKTKPIIFSGPMVRAILDGRKTQTRRVWNHKSRDYRWWNVNAELNDDGWPIAESETWGWVRIPCPYGSPGDRLWVRETWVHGLSELGQEPFYYRADDATDDGTTHWRPSIHMPRSASRITLDITDVRVQRLQDISEEDAIAEGTQQPAPERKMKYRQACWTERQSFAQIWNSLNAKRAPWESNPWVFVLDFKVVDG